MTAGLRVFEIQLPTIGALAVWRDFQEQLFPFRLECSGDVWSMTVDDAVRLGRGADTVARRFRGAAKRGDSVKVGPVFLCKDDAGELIIEIGIGDNDTTYLTLFNLPRVTLQGEQSRALLAALRRVGDDARTCGGGNALGLAQ
jgi:hypothetical protein